MSRRRVKRIRNTNNPFLWEAVYETQIGKKLVGMGKHRPSVAVIDNESGLLLTETAEFIAFKKRIDKTPFIKIYDEGITEILNLSRPAQKVLTVFLQDWIRDESNYSDLIYMNYKSATKDYGYTSNVGYWQKGLREIKNAQFLCNAKEKGQCWYHLNPRYFFKGDRMKLIEALINDPTTTLSHILEMYQNRQDQEQYSNEQESNIVDIAG